MGVPPWRRRSLRSRMQSEVNQTWNQLERGTPLKSNGLQKNEKKMKRSAQISKVWLWNDIWRPWQTLSMNYEAPWNCHSQKLAIIYQYLLGYFSSHDYFSVCRAPRTALRRRSLKQSMGLLRFGHFSVLATAGILEVATGDPKKNNISIYRRNMKSAQRQYKASLLTGAISTRQ